MKTLKQFIFIVSILILANSCKENNDEKPSTVIALKEAYNENFYIGTALSENQILEKDSLVTALISKEFNSITSENIMKSMFIHPTKDAFDFKLTDKYIAFGKKHDMFIHGHTLIWHSQLAPWFSEIKDSTEMALATENHIKTIVSRYKGKINSWDVVNEALNEDGTLRKTAFLDALGEGYLALVFKWASEADSNTDLYYNDYNMTDVAKRKGAIRLVKKLQEKGIKIDGVGMQGHWHIDSPSIEEIEESILDYASLGVKVAITELDINLLPSPWDLVGADVNQNFEGSEKMNPYPKSLPDSIQTKLANRYQDIFKLFLKHQDKISRVTFWGVNDGQSWLNDWPIEGRTNYPLLFDREFKPKQAYDSIISLKK
ncbi:endo-1,4-beta-xylanase [Mariniflexile litorale]|uniref:Beta-xylanase n=1 Tax=Mariniflexile litorale TaxID=3045158 RepID=A0AAU7EHC5_9FLAO|nr:endo-1,4-beta-xylanase [Mariniflexile sp. KMM 9835]MDQ8210827.1 endo-1,4-beta-xylanase [Mariniflexile sp. KMM 9835]